MKTSEAGALKKWKWPWKSSGVMPTTVCGTPLIVTASDDLGIGSQPAPPEVVAQDDPRLRRRRVVDRRIESRSARERHAEGAEVVGRHVQRRHPLGRRARPPPGAPNSLESLVQPVTAMPISAPRNAR